MSEQHAFAGDDEIAAILDAARARPLPPGADYAGAVTPVEAWRLMLAGAARIVDVRTAEECDLVGQVPGVAHVPWRLRGAPTPNPDFIAQLSAVVSQDAIVLLLCRSAQRSHSAAILATAAGFRNVFNILEGFEGDRDESGQRGRLGGWRLYGLPWTQG